MDNEGLVVSSDGTEPAETTVEAGKITVSANPTSSSGNTITIDANDGQIAGLTNTDFDPEATYTGGVAATQEQLSQVNTDLTTAGLNFAGNKGANIHKNLGDTLSIVGGLSNSADASNSNLRVDSDGDKLTIRMAKDLRDLNSITLHGKDGDDGLTIRGGDGATGLDGSDTTRIIYEDSEGDEHEVATLED